MDAERWQRVERLYHAALEREPARRAAFLDESCGDDEGLHREVDEMLALGERHESFLERPALEIALGRGGMTTGQLRLAFAAALGRKPGEFAGEFRLEAGARLGPYEVLDQAGAGGMGEIYRARDTRLGRVVALKVLAGRLTDQTGIRRRFEAEAQAISSLNHPNICTLYDIGQQDGVDYLVMEYLEGQTLSERLKQGPLPYPELLRIAIEVAGALAYAHGRGVIHRDVKPANIILTDFGAKLLDFGLARWAEEAEVLSGVAQPADCSLTVTGLILGTPQYMAPEQVERREVDGRTDIFALGAVLFEMAAGRKAFDGQTSREVMGAILADKGPDAAILQPAIPEGLIEVIRTCLQRRPAERWQSATELHRNLKRLARPDRVLLPLRLAKAVRTGAIATGLLVLSMAAGDRGLAVRQHIQFRNDTKYEILQSFPAKVNLTASPSGLTAGPRGVLYGTAIYGGDFWAGSVFEFDPPPEPGGQWIYSVLYTFTGGSDGAQPEGGLIVGKGGRLYGTTAFGGAAGNGTVFELTPPESPGSPWTEKVLHHFTRQGGDGCDPTGTLVFGDNGELYGTTVSGGIPGQGRGIVFQLTPPATSGAPWTEKVLHRFAGSDDGADPEADLIVGKDGALYGTTSCGIGSAGVVFKLEPPATQGAEWTETVLHRLAGVNLEGTCLSGGLILGENGVLYGTGWSDPDLGSVFELKPPAIAGGPWTETVLHAFTGRNGDGSKVAGGLAIGPDGEFYGTTVRGGQWGDGTIFELKAPKEPGGTWTETVLHSFNGRVDGADAKSNPRLIFEKSGKIYGVAGRRGPEGGGTVFRLIF